MRFGSQLYGTDTPDFRRNQPGDVDREHYSLQRYLALLAAGQTVAIDMLFAPDTAMVRPPSPVWREIQAQAPRFVSRRVSAFVRYCRQQANNYRIKGSRAARQRFFAFVVLGPGLPP